MIFIIYDIWTNIEMQICIVYHILQNKILKKKYKKYFALSMYLLYLRVNKNNGVLERNKRIFIFILFLNK